jgi:hypothetical protein
MRTNRAAAKAAGAKLYKGKPCAKHPESLRRVSNGLCDRCKYEYNYRYAEKARKAR